MVRLRISFPRFRFRGNPRSGESSYRLIMTLAWIVVCVVVLAPGSGQAQKVGQQLIGKLEGPEVVVEPSRIPKSFAESPGLSELVAAGKLPPVKERVGDDPLMIKPVHEIGRYGGTWRRGFTGPGDKWNGYRCCSGPDQILARDYTGARVVPNIAKGWEVSEDGRVTTIYLRRGMRWSDGQPFTADDFVFWFEDMYQNKQLVPTPSSTMTINGKPVVLEKVDRFTIRFKAPDPYYMLPEMLAGPTPLGGQARRGLEAMGGYARALPQTVPPQVCLPGPTRCAGEGGEVRQLGQSLQIQE